MRVWIVLPAHDEADDLPALLARFRVLADEGSSPRVDRGRRLDGRHRCGDPEIQEGRDVVIASRSRPGSVVEGVSRLRRVLSRRLSILFRIVFPPRPAVSW